MAPLYKRPNAVASSSTGPPPRKPLLSGVRVSKPSSSASPVPASTSTPALVPAQVPASVSAKSREPVPSTAVNVHTPAQDVAGAQETRDRRFDGLTDDQVLRVITRPDDWEVPDWGIPPAVPSERADDRLKAKVAKFLDMKYTGDQHINSTLLSSTAFANPHIYAKLVDFVAIAETASAFPQGGWLTRQGLETKRGPWGPSAISDSQRAEAQAIKASQERGQRTEVAFKKARKERDKPYRR